MRLGSLCSGAGGLDMAVEQVFGARTEWHCERDANASKVLAHRWRGVPNHHDLIATDWASVAPIDILCAGWPCQPFSLAGKQLGADDERAIWPHIARAIRLLRPRIVVLENVSAVLRSEFQRVADSLAALGYDLRWTCLRASDVGAPHRRERLFVVACAYGERPQRGERVGHAASQPEHVSHRGPAHDVALLPTPGAADTRGQDYARADRQGSGGDDLVTTAVKAHNANAWGKYAEAIARWETVTRPAPPPTEPNRNGKPRLNPAFSEWMMGWPAGWVTDVPGVSRNEQLRIIGNGVVPQCAEAALRWLLNVSEVAA